MVEAVGIIGTLLTIRSLARAQGEQTVDAARALLREYGEFILAATGPARLCAARLDEEILDPAGYYRPPNRELLVAFHGSEAAGCAGFRELEAAVPERACELKRLWVRPACRGARVGERLAQEVFSRAAAAGYEAIYLDTEPEAMPAAVRLYQRIGFEECPPYNQDKVGGLRFFRRSLL